MRLRPGTLADVPAMATAGTAAFADDELMPWLYPGMEQYPHDYWRSFARRQAMRLHTPGVHVWVVETEATDEGWSGQPELMGYASWERVGSSAAARAWQQDDVFKKIERVLRRIQDQYISVAGLDRCGAPAHAALLRAVLADDFADVPEHWHLQHISVAPAFQRRGVGAALVDWGLRVARREGVPCSLEASHAGRGLYAKKGFRRYGWVDVVPGIDGPTLLWEPEGMEGRWGVREGRSLGQKGEEEETKKTVEAANDLGNHDSIMT